MIFKRFIDHVGRTKIFTKVIYNGRSVGAFDCSMRRFYNISKDSITEVLESGCQHLIIPSLATLYRTRPVSE